MKDIGYYAGFLSAENQQKINNATKAQLIHLLFDISYDMFEMVVTYESEGGNRLPLQFEEKAMDRSDRDKLAVIRGLCDRIELKLMQQAN